MKKDGVLVVVRALVSLVAMVLIWQLVETALENGINGVIFFGGMAAIAGLGGYELRWVIEALRSKTSKQESDKK